METLFDGAMLDAAGQALLTVLQPERIMFLWLGVLVGLAIGLLPGIGGLTGFALLVPFTYTMEPFSGIAMLLGMMAASSISDPIPSVLFGVPGTTASQATVLDGHAMAKKGEAGRALSAAYGSSLVGGLVGAAVLGLAIPILRPLVLTIATPELLAITIFGIAMVSALSGSAPLRGVVAACIGILVGMIGTNLMTGEQRWTGGVLYLWDGVPMLPVLLGLFALPELCDLAIKRRALTEERKFSATEGMIKGLKDCVENWFLILRCSGLGAVLGAIPGISGSVLDWFAYGHAIQTEKGARQTFSKGDVRGVIAPEAATNASTGAILVPAIAFGVPGGAATAILLSALMVHGIVPGPEMLTRNLDMTYSMVWSIALANVFGAGVCFLLSGQLAKISTLRYTLVLPIILSIVYVGAFQGSKSWGDMIVLLGFGVLGWVMKQLKWARPPLILGLVLGALMERYMSISIMRYDADWLLRPGVIVLLGFSFLVLFRPLFGQFGRKGLRVLLPASTRPVFRPEDLLYVFFIVVAGYLLVEAQQWSFSARIGPTVVASTAIIAGAVSLVFVIFSNRGVPKPEGTGEEDDVYMDLRIDTGDNLTPRTIVMRAGMFFAWVLGFLLVMALIGMIPAIAVMIIAFMRIEGREPWKLCIVNSAAATALVYVVFDQIIRVPWPSTVLGALVPPLAAIIPSV
tara:strand:- start:35545 stop:37605 length:2061 start_codon:yes stop_codon:yes gene_type:complete